MIWDVFPFNDELPMLECRLIEMQDYAVTHVLVESPVTHRGDPKPLHYAENRERFAVWKDRIRYVQADLPGRDDAPGMDPWVREHRQREQARQGMEDAEPGDFVLIADVDEIPSAAALTAYPETAVTLGQRVCVFAVDWEYLEYRGRGRTSVLARMSVLGCLNLAVVRDMRESYPVLEDAGWHLTWLGGPAAIEKKLQVHCHSEIDSLAAQVGAAAMYEKGRGLWGADMIPVEVDETWPRYVYNRVAGKKPCCPPEWFRP